MKLTLKIDLPIEFTIEVSATRGDSGKLYGHPDTWRPPDPGEINIEKIYFQEEEVNDNLCQYITDRFIGIIEDVAIEELNQDNDYD